MLVLIILQFVPFRDFVGGRYGRDMQVSQVYLAKEVLAEIPDQITGFMKKNGFKPRDPPPGPPADFVPPPATAPPQASAPPPAGNPQQPPPPGGYGQNPPPPGYGQNMPPSGYGAPPGGGYGAPPGGGYGQFAVPSQNQASAPRW